MSDLLQNHMSTCHTITTHVQGVWDKSNKDWGWLSVGKKVVTQDSKSDLPIVICQKRVHTTYVPTSKILYNNGRPKMHMEAYFYYMNYVASLQ